MLRASSTSHSMIKVVLTIESISYRLCPTILPRMDNFSPSSNFLTLAALVATQSSPKCVNYMNLATYSSTVIVPCLSSRNSRAFACLAEAGKYSRMNSLRKPSHVIVSKSLEVVTHSHYIWDSPSSWNKAKVILVVSEVISIARRILSI